MAERRPSTEERRQVEARARGCCEYCRSQARFAVQSFSVEHVEPRSQKGPTTLDNLALCCQGCNNHKYTKTEAPDPLTDQVVPLYNPRRQRWTDHFAWVEDFTRIIGLTPSGRATVEALHLNRPGLVNLRRVLYAAGEHPPAEPAEDGPHPPAGDGSGG
jgi:5-methylcytosine-specific restriction endonuclease McrA